jgi:2-methylisocitrate lyase-like PEP mutase family enzyme
MSSDAFSTSHNDRFAARRATFRRLHESGFFLIPNPWDVGTARMLRSLGFKALATTSSGLAFSQGLPDADWAVPRDVALEHIRSIVDAVALPGEAIPVNADFESGYAHSPNEVAENVRLCVETGVAGLSIEDATGDRDNPLYEIPLAIERIRAAREAIGDSGVLLTARAECFLVDTPNPLHDAVARLTAYAEAGADVLYAPGISTIPEVEAIVSAVRPKPVNVLVGSSRGLSLAELAALGVRRVSVGSALARSAWSGFLHAARMMAQHNSMEGLDNSVPFDELNNFFREDLLQRTLNESE